MFVRLSKTERQYVVQKERPDFYDEEIRKVEKELESVNDPDDRKEKQELIETLLKQKEKTDAHLKKYGPARWFIKSASKEEISKITARIKATIGSTKKSEKDSITAGMMGVAKHTAIQQFRLGFIRVENIINLDGAEDENSKKPAITVGIKDVDALIDNLSDDVIFEIANEIAGNISENEEKN